MVTYDIDEEYIDYVLERRRDLTREDAIDFMKDLISDLLYDHFTDDRIDDYIPEPE